MTRAALTVPPQAVQRRPSAATRASAQEPARARAAATALSGARPAFSHTPRQLAQRRLVDGLFGAATAAGPAGRAAAASPAVVQLNEESKKTLARLATPQVFPGPEIEVQQKIVDSLEKVLEPDLQKAEKTKELSLWAQTNLGGVMLSSKPGPLTELIEHSKLIDLAEDPKKIGRSIYELIPQETRKLIVINTLATMESAGQLDYLRQSELINEKWRVIVEVHYYRDRSASQLNLHKDTSGQTLFVNLNFNNAEELAGPEYIVNPNMGENYEKHLRSRLPGVFTDDLDSAKKGLGEPKEIGMTRVPKGGVVSFVDEAIHHKTPTPGHRTVTPGTIRLALKQKYGDEYQNAEDALTKYEKQWVSAFSYDSYLKGAKALKPQVWHDLLTALKGRSEFDRTQLAKIIPPDSLSIDELIEKGSSTEFGRASFYFAGKQDTGVPRDEWEHVPVKKEGKPPLKRQMSQALLEKNAPKPSEGRRTFFRTWVRAVPV